MKTGSKQQQELWQEFGLPLEHVTKKKLSHVNTWCKTFIENCTMLLISTADKNDQQIISPRGGSPGFLNYKNGSIYFYEQVGNNLFETVSNILEFQEREGKKISVGALLMIPGINEFVRICGYAEVKRADINGDDNYLDCETNGKQRASKGYEGNKKNSTKKEYREYRNIVISIDIDHWFYQCGRSAKRSQLWDTKIIERNRSGLGVSKRHINDK